MINLRLPTRDSATGRAVATFLQAVVAFVLVALASGDVQTLIHNTYPQWAAGVAVVTSVLTYVNNYLRDKVKNY